MHNCTEHCAGQRIAIADTHRSARCVRGSRTFVHRRNVIRTPTRWHSVISPVFAFDSKWDWSPKLIALVRCSSVDANLCPFCRFRRCCTELIAEVDVMEYLVLWTAAISTPLITATSMADTGSQNLAHLEPRKDKVCEWPTLQNVCVLTAEHLKHNKKTPQN